MLIDEYTYMWLRAAVEALSYLKLDICLMMVNTHTTHS